MENLLIHSKKRDYQVVIGDTLDVLMFNNIEPDIRYFVVYDNNLPKKYADVFKKLSPNCYIEFVDAGESFKTFKSYKSIISKLLDLNITKSDKLIAFGGGTIGDLVGYVAATYKRGINFIYIPTTTLAMVDASIGGKNAINVDNIKNALGTIFPPEKVIVGTNILGTLPKDEFYNGLFEALKTGLIMDKELYDIFLENKQYEKIDEVIMRSIKDKAFVVEKDEDDKNIRKILNYGHTFGHAIEGNENYKIKHGEAIANGMLIMSKGKPYFDGLKNIIKTMDCNIITSLDLNDLMKKIKNDKKSLSNEIEAVFVDEIGSARIEKISFEELNKIGENYVL